MEGVAFSVIDRDRTPRSPILGSCIIECPHTGCPRHRVPASRVCRRISFAGDPRLAPCGSDFMASSLTKTDSLECPESVEWKAVRDPRLAPCGSDFRASSLTKAGSLRNLRLHLPTWRTRFADPGCLDLASPFPIPGSRNTVNGTALAAGGRWVRGRRSEGRPR